MLKQQYNPEHDNIRPFPQKVGTFVDDPLWGHVHIRDQEDNNNPEPDLQGKYCFHPWDWLEVLPNGRVFMCCATWLPFEIGNILDQPFNELWNGEKAQAIRASIVDGSYKYCQKKLCPLIQSNHLEDMNNVKDERKSLVADFPMHVNFSCDESCNLSCPSCRVKKIQFNEGPEYDKRKQINDLLWENILKASKTKNFIHVHITGSGDPWGSKIFREKLWDLDLREYPNIAINFKTNGVMLTEKTWNKMWRIHDRVRALGVSWDACHETTYNVTRRDGDYQQLRKNMKFMNDVAASFPKLKLHFDFVVQTYNYREIPDFVEMMCNDYPNSRAVMFTLVSDWGTWTPDVYKWNAIWKDTHPQYEDLLKVLASVPRSRDSKINWANMKGIVDIARTRYA